MIDGVNTRGCRSSIELTSYMHVQYEFKLLWLVFNASHSEKHQGNSDCCLSILLVNPDLPAVNHHGVPLNFHTVFLVKRLLITSLQGQHEPFVPIP